MDQLREFNDVQGKEQHTTHAMQWNLTKEIEIMSPGKVSVAT